LSRPVIGISRSQIAKVDFGYYAFAFAIWLMGGQPLALDESSHERKIDGLILGGGTDIDPELYSEKPKLDYTYDHKRDDLEAFWLKQADQKDIPVLAICRGSQMMNVQNGGTLHMDISKVYENAEYPSGIFSYMFFRKPINIEEGTILNRISNLKTYMVNSLHKQSVATVGEEMIIAATEPNGVVQGIENPNKKFYMGLQFHPELMMHRKFCRAIFAKLIEAAEHHRHNLGKLEDLEVVHS
jgi:putative glutamine amidotransferase